MISPNFFQFAMYWLRCLACWTISSINPKSHLNFMTLFVSYTEEHQYHTVMLILPFT